MNGGPLSGSDEAGSNVVLWGLPLGRSTAAAHDHCTKPLFLDVIASGGGATWQAAGRLDEAT
jgi:hypothetical protein